MTDNNLFVGFFFATQNVSETKFTVWRNFGSFEIIIYYNYPTHLNTKAFFVTFLEYPFSPPQYIGKYEAFNALLMHGFIIILQIVLLRKTNASKL